MIDDNDLEGIVYKIEKALAGLKAVEDQVERTRSSLTGLKSELEYEAYWSGMSPEELAAERRMIDEHVADLDRRRAAGEPA